MTKQEEQFGKCPVCGGGVNLPNRQDCPNSLHFPTGAMGDNKQGEGKREELAKYIYEVITDDYCFWENCPDKEYSYEHADAILELIGER